MESLPPEIVLYIAKFAGLFRTHIFLSGASEWPKRRSTPQRSKDMDYVYVAIGGFVIFTAVMKRELLIQKGSFRIILLISVILFLVGLVDVALYLVGRGRHFVSGALLCPLITLAQYRLSRRVFLKYVKREPKDTFFIWSGKDLGKDRLFNVLYFTLAFAILIFIIGSIERMVTIGWRP